LGITNPGIQALIVLDWLFGENEKSSLSPSIHRQDQFSFDHIMTNLMPHHCWHLDMHKVRLIISRIQFIPVIPGIIPFPVYKKARGPFRFREQCV
jgi:hypothetical protein